MTKQSVPVYWWKDVPNFGDAIAPMLLKHFSRLDTHWASVSNADLVVTGSVLEHIPPLWEGYVTGAGRLYPGSRLHLHTGRRAEILALRGPLSATGVPGDYALGDPGLLADELVHVHGKQWKLGILPHWSDHDLANDPRFAQFSPKVINPTHSPERVLKEIGSCEKLVTSSLHGMIVADAFGIPRRFEPAPSLRSVADLFKFRDYSQSVKAPFEVGVTITASRFHVEDRKHELFDVFTHLGDLVRRQ